MQIRNKYISELVRFVNQYFGWRNWSVVVYNSVIENVFLIFYIALRNQLFRLNFMIDFFIFLAFSIFSTSYGYLINDFADKELDALHDKENTFEDDSKFKAGLIVLLFLAMSVSCGLHFLSNHLFLPLWVLWILIATFYSLRPFRLKERGKIGLIFAVIAQRVLPILIIFAAFKHFEMVDVVVFTAYIFFRGLSSDLNHQIEDHKKDSVTETDTYAVQAGLRKAKKIFRFSLEMEKGLLIFCLLIMCLNIPYLHIWGISLISPVLLVYVLLYALNWVEIRSQGVDIDVNPFIPNRKDIFQFIHHAFPSVLIPFYLLLLLVYKQWLFIPIVLLFVIFRKMYSLELIHNSFPLRVIRNIIQSQ